MNVRDGSLVTSETGEMAVQNVLLSPQLVSVFSSMMMFQSNS